MRIVACVKQVPATTEVKIDPETGRLVREGVRSVMNPFDLYAVEQAVLLCERLGGETIALSMGPPQARASLQESLYLGADRAILLSDRAFAGSDTWATSYALARAIETLGGVDLVICGKQAIDGDTAQVGPGIAAHLDWPQVTYAAAMTDCTSRRMRLKRMNEDGYDLVEVDLPAVVTVVKDINQPRVPTLKRVLAARKMDIDVWTAETIGADTSCLGLDGSPTRVVRTAPPPPRAAETRVIQGDPEHCARAMVHELRARSIA